MSKPELESRAGEFLERYQLTAAADRLVRPGRAECSASSTWRWASSIGHRCSSWMSRLPASIQKRAQALAEIGGLQDEGMTILLTTHYLEEADRLATTVAIVDRGRIVAEGTPEQLKAEFMATPVRRAGRDRQVNGRAPAGLNGTREAGRRGPVTPHSCGHGESAVPAVLATLEAAGIGSRGDGRPAVAGRRLSAPHRTRYSSQKEDVSDRRPQPNLRHDRRHTRALIRQPWFVASGSSSRSSGWSSSARSSRASSTSRAWRVANYLDYLVPGVLVMTAIFSQRLERHGHHRGRRTWTSWTGTSSGRPARSLIVGRIGYEMFSILVQSLIIGALGFVLGAQFEGGIAGFAALVLCSMLLGARSPRSGTPWRSGFASANRSSASTRSWSCP